ncbi:MAG: GNAT family N-acetyltransferase [Treponema sp.]|nr:GNAT family N-acetyltransferase [Treponema sp.]
MEQFLRRHERRCVAACSLYLHNEASVWALSTGTTIDSLIVQAGGLLFPILRSHISTLPFLKPIITDRSFVTVNGLKADVSIVEQVLRMYNVSAFDRRDYDLMELNQRPVLPQSLPVHIHVRKAAKTDINELFPLQAAYEREEVLPRGSAFNPSLCRLNLEHILNTEQVLVAEYDSHIIGKVHTNAASFSRIQIGGVYVFPAYRRRGIAKLLCGVFAQSYIEKGIGVSLFVNKQNESAQKLYRCLGFQPIADYRVCYF